MLLAAAGGKLSTHNSPVTGEQASRQDTGHPEKAGDNQTFVSELSLTAVTVSASSFDFSQPFILLPSPVWSFVEKGILISTNFDKPYHLLSYFNKIFGNQIAINAP